MLAPDSRLIASVLDDDRHSIWDIDGGFEDLSALTKIKNW